jgi:hypothetical protein
MGEIQVLQNVFVQAGKLHVHKLLLIVDKEFSQLVANKHVHYNVIPVSK